MKMNYNKMNNMFIMKMMNHNPVKVKKIMKKKIYIKNIRMTSTMMILIHNKNIYYMQ